MRRPTLVLLAVVLAACQPLTPRSLIVHAEIALQPGWHTQATAADVHHLTLCLVTASDAPATVASVDATPPFASPLTLRFPEPPDGAYRLTAEAFGSATATSSLSVSGALTSANQATVSGGAVTYAPGTAFTFASNLQLKTGGTITATITGSGGNRVDAAVLAGATTLAQLSLAPATFPVRNLPPGTYQLQATLYDGGGTVTEVKTSAPVTVDTAATGYAVSDSFAVAL